MIVKKLDDIRNSHDHVVADNWESTRLLLARDGMGFSLHVTRLHAGRETLIWYRNHLEAVYCIAGEGEVETLEDGKIHSITPNTVYALNRNDRHVLRAFTDMTCVCVFNPPLHGREVHDADGVYPLAAESVAP